jgi:ribosomal-protein-serine acetyltransferase
VLDAPLTLAGGLGLRRWRPADAPALSRAVEESLDHLRPWMPWAGAEPLPLAERVALIEQWQAEWESGGAGALGMWVGDAVVGACGLHRRVGPGGLEIGYWVHPQHVRRGHATAATRALTTLAFALPKVERVEVHNDRGNAVSARVPRRLGFELVGEIAHPPVAASETGVRQLWQMRRERWAALAPG